MNRRALILGLGGAAASYVSWPLLARAQQALPIIGFLSSTAAHTSQALRVVPFLKGLKEAGFIEGQNVHIAFAWAENDYDRLPALAAELINRQVAVIAADTPAAVAAKAATQTIPVVFNSGADPIQLGLVASLNRPGGNATGVHVFSTELGPKRLELLRQVVPNGSTIAFMVPPTATAGRQVNELQTAAAARGQQILVLNAGNENEINEAFATMVERRVAAVLYGAAPFFQVRQDQLITLAARHAIPAMYEWREFVTAGGLMSYSTNRAEAFRQVGIYAGRVLKGANPADLPVVQAIRLEFDQPQDRKGARHHNLR